MTAEFRNPHFDSERLTMRPQSKADAEALYEAYSDAELMTWWSSAPHASVDETRDYMWDASTPSDWRGWVMAERATGAVVGTLAAGTSRKPQVVEIGYLLIRRYWGRGYASEGVTRLIDLLFEEGHRRVWADTDPDNAASNRLLQRLGFTLEGRLRGEWETHIGVRDALIWGLLRDEWRRP